MRSMVAIKVRIGLKPNGHAKYPNFNLINASIRKNLDWAHFVDNEGLGWHYDKISGHKDETLDSPLGQQWGVLIVPEGFANAALSMFPDDVFRITEAELEDFYDNRSHVREPGEHVTSVIVDAIKARQELGIELTTEHLKALDPDDPTPGIVKNRRKRWSDFKKLKKVVIL